MFDSSKSVAVIGLGTFGTAVARKACENGARVLGVDIDQTIVDRMAGELDNTIGADARDAKALRECALDDQDIVIIAVGSDIEASLLAAHHAKALGAKIILVKAQSDAHRDILLAIGVDEVLLPEVEAGHRLADRLISSD